jgi:hypothetical protein
MTNSPPESSASPARIRLRSNIVPVVGLVLATLLIYAPAFRFSFLNWDDSWYILWNDFIKSWSPANLYGILTEPVARNYAPVTIAGFLIEHTLWGERPAGYHVTNVCLHALNAVLVFRLLQQLTRNDWLAWGVAALFVVHPVQVESVAWVVRDVHAGEPDLLAPFGANREAGRVGLPVAGAGAAQ